MFIAIVGTRLAGKSTIEDYLVSKGFISVHLARPDLVEPHIVTPATHKLAVHLLATSGSSRPPDTSERQSFLNMNSPVSSAFPQHTHPMTFTSPEALLSHVTRNWRKDFVTADLTSSSLVNPFAKRPFFLLVNVDAPLLQRYCRLQGPGSLSLEEFVRQDDECVFGIDVNSNQKPLPGLHGMNHLVKLNVINTFQSLSELHLHLDSLDVTDTERLRPQWDTYFMAWNVLRSAHPKLIIPFQTLAELASQRSNCMKRRVGAILVRDNRIVATGYNGTPRGVTNCNDGEECPINFYLSLLTVNSGGCAQCNQTTSTCDVECLCLHAEENALLEAGRDRVGINAILYCNTCPCLKCTIKIIQSGVMVVVYNLSYKVDEASARLFKEAGVEIRRHVPPAT